MNPKKKKKKGSEVPVDHFRFHLVDMNSSLLIEERKEKKPDVERLSKVSI